LLKSRVKTSKYQHEEQLHFEWPHAQMAQS
jgi:hypothetical protein